MDIRDKIAIAVFPAIYKEYFDEIRSSGISKMDEHWREGLAIDAYAMADAMIAMRSAKVADEKGINMPFGDMPQFPSIRGA